MDLNLINLAGLQASEAKQDAATRGTDALRAPHGATSRKKADLWQAAKDFEAMVIGQMMQPMFNTIPTDGKFSGGYAEEMFRTMMVDELGKTITNSGGIGIASQVYTELLKTQEV